MQHRLLILILGAGLTTSITVAQAPEPSNEADGFVHVMLTLESQAISLAYEPDLSGDERARRQVLAGMAGARVEVGTLEGHRALRIGTLATDFEAPPPEPLAEGFPKPAPATHELWLVRNAQGWELEAQKSDSDDVNIIPLSHHERETTVQKFSASLHSTDAEEGRLELRWGHHVWNADFRFDELPRPSRRPRVSGLGQAREAETDTTGLVRRTMLAERNETALVFPDGRRIQMLFWKGIGVEGEDYGRLSDVDDGAVVPLVRAPPLRIKSDVGLRFGATDVATGNLAPGFAGAYAVWLRKTGTGWRFVFNNEPDSWGTQYDPDFDAAEIDVDYARTGGSFRPLGVTLVPTGEDTGRVVIHWGPHEWAADFVVAE